MRILLGIQATGNGHLSRCSALAEALEAHRNVEVDFLVSGRARDKLFDMQAFPNWEWRRGLSFIVENGQINRFKTITENDWWQFWRDVRNLDLTPYDLIVTDYEPIVAWAARLQRQRCIGIGRQYTFYETTKTVHMPLLQRKLTKLFAPVTDVIGMHWVEDAQHALPPIIHRRADPCSIQENLYLVYLPFEPLIEIEKLLNQFPHQKFSVFHPEATRRSKHNIDYYPPSRKRFAEHFMQAAGVISNAGFETSSEALAFGKRLFVRPLAGQIEQIANAQCLAALDLATQSNQLSVSELKDWFANSRARQCHWPDVAESIANWLANGAKTPIADLSRQLWKRSSQIDTEALLVSDYCNIQELI